MACCLWYERLICVLLYTLSTTISLIMDGVVTKCSQSRPGITPWYLFVHEVTCIIPAIHTQGTTRLTTYTLSHIHILNKLTATVSSRFVPACIEPRGWFRMNGFPQLLSFVLKVNGILQWTLVPSLSKVVTCITIDWWTIHTPSQQYWDVHYKGEVLMKQSSIYTGNSYTIRAHLHIDSVRYIAFSKEMCRTVEYTIQTDLSWLNQIFVFMAKWLRDHEHDFKRK